MVWKFRAGSRRLRRTFARGRPELAVAAVSRCEAPDRSICDWWARGKRKKAGQFPRRCPFTTRPAARDPFGISRYSRQPWQSRLRFPVLDRPRNLTGVQEKDQRVVRCLRDCVELRPPYRSAVCGRPSTGRLLCRSIRYAKLSTICCNFTESIAAPLNL